MGHTQRGEALPSRHPGGRYTAQSKRHAEEEVRAAVESTNARRHARRSAAAKKAAETRRKRRERRVYVIAKKLTDSDGAPLGPRGKCAICDRPLGDQQSIERGIGSECWQDVLAAVAAKAVGA